MTEAPQPTELLLLVTMGWFLPPLELPTCPKWTKLGGLCPSSQLPASLHGAELSTFNWKFTVDICWNRALYATQRASKQTRSLYEGASQSTVPFFPLQHSVASPAQCPCLKDSAHLSQRDAHRRRCPQLPLDPLFHPASRVESAVNPWAPVQSCTGERQAQREHHLIK